MFTSTVGDYSHNAHEGKPYPLLRALVTIASIAELTPSFSLRAITIGILLRIIGNLSNHYEDVVASTSEKFSIVFTMFGCLAFY